MFKVGERVRWRSPLDADYSYGTIVSLRYTLATVEGSGYYKGVLSEVHVRYIESMERGGKSFGGNKKQRKRAITKSKL